MAAPMSTAGTPRRCYNNLNVCVLCGMSFIVSEITQTGEVIQKKNFTQKLKLTSERKKVIRNVIEEFQVDDDIDKDNGVCRKCFKRVENVINLDAQARRLKVELRETRSTVRNMVFSQSKMTEKRLLRSPGISLPSPKQIKTFPSLLSTIQLQPLVKIPSFNTIIRDSTIQLSLPLLPVSTRPIPILPKPESHPDDPETLQEVKKKTKRSLKFSTPDKENRSTRVDDKKKMPLEGTVKVTVYYPSGKKNALITNEAHQKICKALVRGSNIDEIIIESICTANPMAVVNGSCKIIKGECAKASRRGSGSILQKKDYEDFFNFRWENLHNELQNYCPALLSAVTAIVSDIPPSVSSKPYHHILMTTAIGLHGRSQEMSLLQFMSGFLLTHGGCTQRNIEKLSHIGLTVHPITVQRKLTDWQHILDAEIVDIREAWANGGSTTYQLIGDNWDRNILPSFRTSDRKTVSLHLFNIYAIVDRISFAPASVDHSCHKIGVGTFIPSVAEQQKVMKELCFIVSTSIIQNHPKMERLLKNIYPKHFEHQFSTHAGIKTKQYQLGLSDTNENKTQEVIKMLKDLSRQYVPCKDGEIVESVFFGGDRLTDERVQSAQQAMANASTPLERLEGFISKIEDFHRLMNFLEAIHKMTYNSKSGSDICTVYYFRNVLNMRNVKGKVCNSYRAYKLLYYAILDALCLLLFLDRFNIKNVDDDIPVPENFEEMTDAEKVGWMDNISCSILQEWFLDKNDDMFKELREVVTNPEHPENYWVSNLEEDGRVKCHHCDKNYTYVGSLKAHEQKVHNVRIEKTKPHPKKESKDQLHEYLLMLFKLTLLHKNLDTGVDMGDGERVVRSAKYELPIYNYTNKIKYLIGSIHLTALTSGILPEHQRQRLVANRFVNVQGGKNNNISLDEYIEMLNRDSKIACSGHQTKNSILQHSKEYPHLINFANHFEDITSIRKKKGFHHLPSYKADVQKILKDLIGQDVLTVKPSRNLQCREFVTERNPFSGTRAYRGLSTMIHRHQPVVPFHRLRDPHI